MRKLFNLTLFLGIMILASCSSEIDLRDNPLLLTNQVKFTSTIGAVEVSTRVTGTNWDQGDAIGVYALNAGQAIPDGIYGKDNAKFTTPDAGAQGTFTPATTDDQIAYPSDGAKLDFVAYYPYAATVTDNKLPINVSVQTNSSAIDYLYSNNVTGKSIADQSANLNFKHKLSQLIININGAAFDNFNTLTAVVKGMKVDGSLDLKDGVVTAGSTAGDITPLLNADKSVAAAIVVPGQDMKDITVEFALGDVKFVWHPEALTLESGKKYTYNIKLTKEGVVLEQVGATIEDWEEGYTGTGDIVLQPEEGEEGGGEEPVEPEAGLLFPGSDFEDWDAFLGGLTTHGLKSGYTEKSSDAHTGSAALYLNGKPTGNDYVFTALVPEGFDPAGKNAIVFWIKGTSAKSLSLNVYKAGGGYQAFNLETYNAERVIAPAANNQYNGVIDTGGDWMKVVVDISSVSLASTVGESLFALKVGKDVVYDLLIDDFTLEAVEIDEGGEVEKTFKADKTTLSLGADANLSGTINLTSTEAWTATSSESWLTVAPASGTGNQAVTLTAGKNEAESPRTATVTFKATGMDDVVVNVTQVAAEGGGSTGPADSVYFLETFGDGDYPSGNRPKVAAFTDFDNKNVTYSDPTGEVDIRSTSTINPSLWFPANKNTSFIIEGIDLSGGTDLVLKYELAVNNVNTDFNVMKVKINGIEVDVPSQIADATNKYYVVTLTGISAGNNVKVEFSAAGTDNKAGFRLDNITIVSDPSATGGIVAK